MIDTIVTAGTVITVDPDRRVVANGAVAIDNGTILAVGDATSIEAEYDATTTIRRPRGVMMPGLVDAHSHAGHSLIRTMADDLDLWMDACHQVFLHGATPEFWHAEGRLTASERLLAGTTTALSMLGGAGDTVRADTPEHGIAHIDAVADVGLRTVLVVGPGAPPYPKRTTTYPGGAGIEVSSTLEDQLSTVRALHTYTESVDTAAIATTFTTLAPEQIDPATQAAAAEVINLAQELGILIVQDGHRAETVRASDALGLLGPNAVLSHATDLDEVEIELLAQAGASVAHNPSAIFSQFGRCPVPELIEAGVPVGLGSDATAPDRSADMFRHMFQLTRYHRATRQDPTLFPPGTAIEMATIQSARVLGLGDRIGSLEPGKRADIIVVDADRPHLSPLSHPVHQIVYFATGADVELVLVDGDVLVDGGVATTVDMDSILEAARREQAAAFSRVDLEQPADRQGLWGSVQYASIGDDATG